MEAISRIVFYPIVGGPEDIPVCEFVKLRCVLARGDQRNCALGTACINRLLEGYKLAGDTWICKSCEVPFGSNIHRLSCGIGGPGAK